MNSSGLSTKIAPSTEKWLSLVLIIIVCLLGYGLLVHRLGYDFDDWPWLFAAYTHSWADLQKFGAPGGHLLQAPLMTVFYSFLGLSPLGWHLAAFLLRLSMVVLFWWCLRLLWPERHLETTFAALLFGVYPGYQHDPLILSGPFIYFPLAVFLLSLLAMVAANHGRERKWTLDLAALVCIPVYFLAYEVYGGLELLRPLMLWLLGERRVHPESQSRLKWVIRRWFPYLLVFAAVVIYRLFIYAPPRKSTSIGGIIAHYLDNPIYALGQHVSWGITGLMEAALVGWTPALGALTILTKSALVGWFLLLLSGGLVFTYSCYFSRISQVASSNPEKDECARVMLFVGLIAIVLGVIVPVLTFRVPLHQGEQSRFLLAPAIGASLFVVALAKLVLRPQFLNVFIGFLVGSCVAANFSNAWVFKRDWDFQRSLYWQLSWRAPVIRSGTVLLFDVPPSPVEPRTDYVLAAPANFIYGNRASQPTLWAENLRKPRKPINQIILHQRGEYSRKLSTLTFQGNMRDSLVLYMDGRGVVKEPCLKVLSRDYPVVPSSVSPIAGAVAAYSNLDRIMYAPKSSIPPGGVLGAEPPHRWCYYYQRIELYRQQQDWAEVVRLTDEAQAKGFFPEDLNEWMPSIEGYVHAARLGDARLLLTKLWEVSPNIHWDVCSIVERLRKTGKLTSSEFGSFC